MNAKKNSTKVTAQVSQDELDFVAETEMDETEMDLLDDMLTERKLTGRGRGGASSSLANIAAFYGENDCDWS